MTCTSSVLGPYPEICCQRQQRLLWWSSVACVQQLKHLHDRDVNVALPVGMSNISQHKSEHTRQLQGSPNVTPFSLPASMQWLGLALHIQYTRSVESNLQRYLDYCLKCMTTSKKRTHLRNAFSQASKHGVLLVFLLPQCHHPCRHARHHKSNAKFSITSAQETTLHAKQNNVCSRQKHS